MFLIEYHIEQLWTEKNDKGRKLVMHNGKEKEGFKLFEAMGTVDLSQPLNLKPVRKGEKVLGVMNDSLTRIFHVRVGLIDQAKKASDIVNEKITAHMVEHDKPDHDRASCRAFHKELDPAINEIGNQEWQIKLVDDVFWSAMRLEFPAIDDGENEGVSIRDGGQVAVVPANNEGQVGDAKALLNLLRDLLR